MNKHNVRYIVAYPNPTKESSDFCTNREIYWYEREAKRAAEFIGGWVITIDLAPVNQQQEQHQA